MLCLCLELVEPFSNVSVAVNHDTCFAPLLMADPFSLSSPSFSLSWSARALPTCMPSTAARFTGFLPVHPGMPACLRSSPHFQRIDARGERREREIEIEIACARPRDLSNLQATRLIVMLLIFPSLQLLLDRRHIWADEHLNNSNLKKCLNWKNCLNERDKTRRMRRTYVKPKNYYLFWGGAWMRWIMK